MFSRAFGRLGRSLLVGQREITRLDRVHDHAGSRRVLGRHPEVTGAHPVGALALSLHEHGDVLGFQSSSHQLGGEGVTAGIYLNEVVHGPNGPTTASSSSATDANMPVHDRSPWEGHQGRPHGPVRLRAQRGTLTDG